MVPYIERSTVHCISYACNCTHVLTYTHMNAPSMYTVSGSSWWWTQRCSRESLRDRSKKRWPSTPAGVRGPGHITSHKKWATNILTYTHTNHCLPTAWVQMCVWTHMDEACMYTCTHTHMYIHLDLIIVHIVWVQFLSACSRHTGWQLQCWQI